MCTYINGSNNKNLFYFKEYIDKEKLISKILTNIESKIKVVEEFNAIAKGGLYLADKKETLIVSVGTGTALIRACENSIEHLGGTGVGAGATAG